MKACHGMTILPVRLATNSIGPLLENGADEIGFFLAVGLAVGAEDFVEPDGRFAADVGMLPGIPGKVGLRFSGDQSPVDGGDVLLFRQRKNGLEGAPCGPGHVFGAQQWAMILPQPLHVFFEIFRRSVIVKGNYVGKFQLNFFGGTQFFR